MPIRIPSPWFLVVVAALAIGCDGNSLSTVDVPDQLVLYSIDGRDFVSNQLEKPITDESFHEYPVLGKMEIEDRTAKREIISAVKDGVRQSDGTLAKCFWPRHGIRVVSKGRIIEYVICFECLQLEEHLNGHSETKPTTRSPQQVLNRYLRDAGVPLAPGMVD